MLAPKQMICVSGDRTTYAGRHAQIAGRIVVELLGKLDGPVGRLDDDPLVLGAAQRLSLDHLAGEPVTDQARAEFLRRLPGAGLEFHDFAGPHS
jgi:hypothetical protein